MGQIGRMLVVVVVVVFTARAVPAQTTTLSSSATYDGSIAPFGDTQSPGILVIDGSGSPVLTLTNNATTSGVQGLYLGTTSGRSGGLDIYGSSLFTNLGDASLGAVAGGTGSAVSSGSAWNDSGNLYLGGTNGGPPALGRSRSSTVEH
jgi:hypothetical protein